MAELIRSAWLGAVPHGFSTRAGAGADHVLPGAPMLEVRQIHSADVVTVAEPWPGTAMTPPEGDAIVTDQAGLLLSIVTADCAPVLLADAAGGVIGAAHAGWRGALGGVIGNTVAAMEALGARRERIVAAIGPCIAQANYEVDDLFRARFGEEASSFFAPGRTGHWQFDLSGYVAARLEQAGVGRVEQLGLDTYADPGRFHSYRRATHRGEAGRGRQTSLIGLAPAG